MKYGKVIDGKVAEVFIPLPGFTIEQSLHPSLASQFIQIADDLNVGDEYVIEAEVVEDAAIAEEATQEVTEETEETEEV